MNTQDTPPRRPNGAANPGFLTHLKQRSDQRRYAIALIHELLLDQAQPLTVPEIRELAVRANLNEGYDKFDLNLIRQFVYQLREDGLAYSRVETDAERLLRSSGKQTAGKPAALYSASSPVPARTVSVAVDGVRLRGLDEREPRKPKGKKRGRPKGAKNRPKSPTPASGLPPQSPVSANASAVATLIEKLVAERTAELAARLLTAEVRAAHAEARLHEVRRALSS